MVCSGLASGSKKLHAKGQMFCVAEVGNVVASELSCAILALYGHTCGDAKLQSIRPVNLQAACHAVFCVQNTKLSLFFAFFGHAFVDALRTFV